MPPRPSRSTRPARGAGRSRELESNGADSPPDAKHYAIMGSLLVGPPLLVIILFIALSGGGGGSAAIEEDPAIAEKEQQLRELTERNKQAAADARKVQALVQEARELHEQSKFERNRFYQKDEEREKTAAFQAATRILKSAQNKLEEAYNLDRRGTSANEIQDLQQQVNQDLHNIMKDKPIYVD